MGGLKESTMKKKQPTGGMRFVIEKQVRAADPRAHTPPEWAREPLHSAYSYTPLFDTRGEAETMLDWLEKRGGGPRRVVAVAA